MTDRLRTTLITVFCAYIGFVFAGLAYYEMVVDSPFSFLMYDHLELLAAWLVVAGGSVAALLAVAVGGIPLGLSVLLRAWTTRRKDLLLLLAVPVIAMLTLGAFVLAAAALITSFFTEANTRSAIGMVIPWIPDTLVALIIVAVIASTASVCLAVSRSDVHEHTFKLKGITIIVQPYRFAMLPALIATLSMGLMLTGTVAWGMLVRSSLPESFDNSSTIGGLTNATLWAGIVLVMAVTTAVAASSVERGMSAQTSWR